MYNLVTPRRPKDPAMSDGQTMQDFFAMGGYAAYIWPAYGVAALILAGIVVESLIGLNRRRAELARLEGDSKRERRA
jgi:heme exporter protein D